MIKVFYLDILFGQWIEGILLIFNKERLKKYKMLYVISKYTSLSLEKFEIFSSDDIQWPRMIFMVSLA